MRDLDPTLRRRQVRDASEVARRPIGLSPAGQPSFVGRIVADARQPTAPGYYYLVNPVAVRGAEAEGGAPLLVADTTTSALVCVIGTKAPSSGDDLICRFIENRWVAERYGATSPPPPPPPPPTIPGCTCTSIPATLQMSSAGPCVPSDFQACTLQWGPTPAEFAALSLGASCFLSTQVFSDPFTGGTFRYNLSCDYPSSLPPQPRLRADELRPGLPRLGDLHLADRRPRQLVLPLPTLQWQHLPGRR